MVYVAFLRGINVGGKTIVSMAAIKEALVDLGLSDVRTYINSGNVIFSKILLAGPSRKGDHSLLATLNIQRTGGLAARPG